MNYISRNGERGLLRTTIRRERKVHRGRGHPPGGGLNSLEEHRDRDEREPASAHCAQKV